ncbi:hypothetical protein BH10BAC4_BH10BAC4_18710 [soil metagenome]
MKNNIEKFVRDHRDQFDDKTPGDIVWSKVSEAVFNSKSFSFWNSVSVWRAAAIVLMGFSAYLFFTKPSTSPVKAMAMQQEFLDIESFYSSQISEKVALISTEGLFADDSFTQDIQKLEAMYTVLADEMKKHPSEKVKDALVLNMLVRIDLLNQQIQKLEETKKRNAETAII